MFSFLLTIFFVTLIIVIYYNHNINKKTKRSDEIPTVSGWPLAWALLRQKNHDEVQDAIYKSSKGHDIYYTSTGNNAKYLTVTNPEYAKNLLAESEEKFDLKSMNASYEFYGNGLTFANGETWRTNRRLANPAFNKALSPQLVGEAVIELFTFMKKNLNRPVGTFEIMQLITVEVLGRLAFGTNMGWLESEETPQILNDYKLIIETIESPYRTVFPWISKLPTEHNRKLSKSIEAFDGFIYDIIERKRKELSNNNTNNSGNDLDLLTNLIKLGEQEGINTSSKQLRDDLVIYFVAGHDTTATALTVSLYYLARYPEMQEKARAEVIKVLGNEPIIPNSDQLKEMKYINAVIKESLRLCPPAAGTSLRMVKRPTKVGPYVVPENTKCLINIWQIHYNSNFWENPKQFDPERFLNNEKRHPLAWMPFAYGPRNCIGQNFTLMEQRVILSMMLLKYNWALPKNTIHKNKVILESRFLLKPVELNLVFSERILKR